MLFDNSSVYLLKEPHKEDNLGKYPEQVAAVDLHKCQPGSHSRQGLWCKPHNIRTCPTSVAFACHCIQVVCSFARQVREPSMVGKLDKYHLPGRSPFLA